MAGLDDDELLDALGVEVAPIKTASRTPREERIIAGLRTFCGSIKRTVAHRSTGKSVTSLSGCMPCV